MRIYRRFLDIEDGQIHYREAGLENTVKVLMLHASPGSSKQLEPLIARLAENFHVFAPDTLGNGDSMAPLQEQPEIADYANVMIEFLDRLELNKVHLYGTHTGARIATYLALQARRSARIDSSSFIATLAPAVLLFIDLPSNWRVTCLLAITLIAMQEWRSRRHEGSSIS